MNSLSWMIYAAEVSNQISFLSGVTGFCLAIAGGVYSVTCRIYPDTLYGSPEERRRRFDDRVSFRPKAAKLLIGGVAIMAASSFIPSSSTIYMIAASEAGETIVTSPEAKEVFDDLKTIIKSKLKEQLPKP